jgi:hypothetical protein
MTGVWEVRTHSSVHIWDLELFTYTRAPGPTGARMDWDGVPHRITRVEAWPAVVGTASLVFYDDPVTPDLLEQWRRSATILSIRRSRPPALPNRPHDAPHRAQPRSAEGS